MYAAHVPVPRRLHAFLFSYNLVAIRETFWIPASFLIPKERMDLKGRGSLEAYSFVDRRQEKTLGDNFFMKHSAKLNGSRFTALSRAMLCGDVPHLKMYSVDKELCSKMVLDVGLKLIWKRFLEKKCLDGIQLGFLKLNCEEAVRLAGPCRSGFRERKIFFDQKTSNVKDREETAAS